MTDGGSNINVEKDIRELVAEILETDPSEINGAASFVKDLGMDSMMALEVLASIEKNIASSSRKTPCPNSPA